MHRDPTLFTFRETMRRIIRPVAIRLTFQVVRADRFVAALALVNYAHADSVVGITGGYYPVAVENVLWYVTVRSLNYNRHTDSHILII